jgi:hypothetical protein
VGVGGERGWRWGREKLRKGESRRNNFRRQILLDNDTHWKSIENTKTTTKT